MSKIYCVGDIHGCSATLEDLLLKKIRLQKSDKLIFIAANIVISNGENNFLRGNFCFHAKYTISAGNTIKPTFLA